MSKTALGPHPTYFDRYISLVAEDDLQTAFKNQLPVITDFLNSISEEKSMYAYAPGKWTIKELLQHMTDTERIFGYRSLCFARKEAQSLPGFDEDLYAASSNANSRSWASLVSEFLLVRQNTEVLFGSFTEAALLNAGTANNNPATALSMGFTTIGHVYHHKKYWKNVTCNKRAVPNFVGDCSFIVLFFAQLFFYSSSLLYEAADNFYSLV